MSISNVIRSVLRPHSTWPSNNAFAIRTLRRTFTAGTITNDDMTTDVVEEVAEAPSWSPKMIAWQAHSYGTIDDLVLTSNARSPLVVGPRELLVRIKASSVNPLDALMAGKWTSPVSLSLYQFDIFTIFFRGFRSGIVGHHSPSTTVFSPQTHRVSIDIGARF